MKDRKKTKTLILVGNGSGWLPVVSDTLFRGILRLKYDSTYSELSRRSRKVPLFYKILRQFRKRYEALSYAVDWQDALSNAPELDAEIININNLIDFIHVRKQIETYPLIIILHSAAGDSMSLLLKTVRWFRRRSGKLVMFLGNEYDLMFEKKSFIRSAKVDFVCSQLPEETAKWLYSDCTSSKVLHMPHALNSDIYKPLKNHKDREFDVGFIGAKYPYFIGDKERNDLLEFFQNHCGSWGLGCNMRFLNVPRKEWVMFLNSCKGIIGAEAGTYFLDKEGQLVSNAKKYMRKNPNAKFSEVFEHCFKYPGVEYISGKAISSRHFEAIGTKTCQILLEGYYNGILKPDVHYISVKRDLSNISDAVDRFKDDTYREKIIEEAYKHVMSGHTYRHRVKDLVEIVLH